MCIYIYTHTDIYIYIHMCIYIYTHTDIHIIIHMLLPSGPALSGLPLAK